jgi:hypothetical protein
LASTADKHHFSKDQTSVKCRVARFFLGPNIPKRKNITKLPQNTPNGHKLYQKDIKYSRWSFSIPRPTKVYPNWDFRYENKPSGISGQESKRRYKAKKTTGTFAVAKTSKMFV